MWQGVGHLGGMGEEVLATFLFLGARDSPFPALAAGSQCTGRTAGATGHLTARGGAAAEPLERGCGPLGREAKAPRIGALAREGALLPGDLWPGLPGKSKGSLVPHGPWTAKAAWRTARRVRTAHCTTPLQALLTGRRFG